MLPGIEDYKSKNMNTEKWIKEIEQLVANGIDTNKAITHITNLKNEYIDYKTTLAPTKQKENTTLEDLINKLKLENIEVQEAFKNNDLENLKEELLDSMQMILNILSFIGIKEGSLEDAVLKHKLKLESRKWEFNSPTIMII